MENVINWLPIKIPALQKFNVGPILLFIALLLVVAITYGPVLTSNYAFADDYFYLWSRLYQHDWMSNLLIQGALQARPLDGLLFVIAMTAIKSINGYIYLRAFTMIEVGVLAYLIYDLLIESGWTGLQGFFLTLSLLSLPPMQVIFAWSSASFFVLASILAFLSVKIIFTDQSTTINKKALMSMLLVLAAMAIYQPWAMLYWLVAAIYLSSDKLIDGEKQSKLFRLMSVFLVACVLDFVMLLIAKSCFKHVPVDPGRTHLTNNLGAKLVWFISGPLVDALNLNHLMVSPQIAIITGFFIVSGLWLYFKLKDKQQSLFAWLMAIAFVPLSYLPNLAIAESFYTYRTELGLSTLLLFYAYLSASAFLKKIWQDQAAPVLTTIIVVSSLMNLYAAHRHIVQFFVAPQIHELEWFKAQLRGDFGKARQLQPIYPERSDTTAPFNRHDEFGMPTFACPWVREPGTIILRKEINAYASAAIRKQNKN